MISKAISFSLVVLGLMNSGMIITPTAYAGVIKLEEVNSYTTENSSKTWITEANQYYIMGNFLSSSGSQQPFIINKNTNQRLDLPVNVSGAAWGSISGNYAYFNVSYNNAYKYDIINNTYTPFDEYPIQIDDNIGSFDPLNVGHYVGTWHEAYNYPWPAHPFYYNGSQYLDVPLPSGYVQGWATGIYNEKIVGRARTGYNYSPGEVGAFLYNSSSNVVELLPVPELQDVWENYVVGGKYLYDLSSQTLSEFVIEGASGLEILSIDGSDGLVVTGSYLDSNGIQNGFIANVPEPSALSLLAVGLGGLAMFRRRRS